MSGNKERHNLEEELRRLHAENEVLLREVQRYQEQNVNITEQAEDLAASILEVTFGAMRANHEIIDQYLRAGNGIRDRLGRWFRRVWK